MKKKTVHVVHEKAYKYMNGSIQLHRLCGEVKPLKLLSNAKGFVPRYKKILN